MLSTVGTLATSILQFSRTLFATSRDGFLHAHWAAVHARWKTPWAGTLLIAVLGAALLALSVLFDSLDTVMKASIQAISVQAAWYYGLAGFACAWHFRREALRSPFNAVFMVAWPAASALVLWASALYNLQHLDWVTVAIAIGGILLGFIPLALWRRRLKGR
jgi:amino acid transporter